MNEQFSFDVFVSYGSKDKAIARAIAERLQQDGLTVSLDEWLVKPSTTKLSHEKKIEEGLRHSRVLVLCISPNADGSQWVQQFARLVAAWRPDSKPKARDADEQAAKKVIHRAAPRGIPAGPGSEAPSRTAAETEKSESATNSRKAPYQDMSPKNLNRLGRALQGMYGSASIYKRGVTWSASDYPTGAPEPRITMHGVSFTHRGAVSELWIQKTHGPYQQCITFYQFDAVPRRHSQATPRSFPTSCSPTRPSRAFKKPRMRTNRAGVWTICKAATTLSDWLWFGLHKNY
jgi:hypothetical protein